MSEQLQQAYNALMVKAPGAAFQKARALYLNKYPLPQADGSAPLRLYVCDEQLEESIQPCLLYTSPSPRDVKRSRMPSSA